MGVQCSGGMRRVARWRILDAEARAFCWLTARAHDTSGEQARLRVRLLRGPPSHSVSPRVASVKEGNKQKLP